MVCSIDLKYYDILQFNFYCFLSVTFDHITTLDKQSCFLL